MSGQSWPEAETARLAALWAAGISSGKIARAMGRSRSAVLCRAHRMKLTPRPKAAPALPRLVDKPVAGPRSRPDPPPPKRPLVVWAPAGTVHACQWPFGSRPYSFCGDASEPGRPYCLRHCRAAFIGYGAPRSAVAWLAGRPL